MREQKHEKSFKRKKKSRPDGGMGIVFLSLRRFVPNFGDSGGGGGMDPGFNVRSQINGE